MSVYKTYSCGICKSNPDQISHHKSHLETQKHKDKKELFELKLKMLSQDELLEKYKTTNINDIIIETETKLYLHNEDNNKKLTDEVENKELTQDEIDILKYTMSEQTNSISNKEALKDKIHEIHNYLRNNGAGYGMNALKVFNILYGLKKIEENGLLDKVKLERPTCEFSYLLNLANENKGEILAEMILKDVLDSIHNSELKDILFYEIPKKIKGSVFVFLLKEIEKITKIEKSCNVLLSGKIYEYFIGRDESAISELGAYFTDRHIVDYILKKLDPKVNKDGSINSMIDMFGGSGGFTTGYINHMNDNNPNVINWDTEINKVYHYDMNEDVIKSAALELFCLTGVLPNMKNNLGYKNSFTDDFSDEKYKYPLTNPPYGGDKNCKSEALTKREKIKAFIKNELLTITDEGMRIRRQKQLKSHEALDKQDKKESEKTKVSLVGCSARIQRFAYKNSLKGNDKESCSLMLLMDILDVGGTAIGVLKEGVFFNKTYKDLRKCLIENYNVREVISVPADQFENTSTKTSIIIFDNIDEKTTEVKFSDLIVGRYTEDKFCEYHGDIVIIESKDDIKEITDVVVSVASKEDILTNAICSLNGKDYNKKEIICGEGYELVKLGDISSYLQKSKRKASFGELIGKYNFYTSSDKVQKCDEADYKEECLIIGDGGVANIKIDNMFSCSDHNHIIKTSNIKYIYYLISGNMTFLIDGFKGSVLKNISKEYLTKLNIPIPKSQEKINEWVDKISLPYNEKTEKQLKIKELETFVQNRINEIGENEECDIVELGSVCEIQDGCEFKDTDLNTDVNNIPLIRATYITNKIITNYIKKNTKFDKYIVKKGDIIFSQVGNVGSMCKYHENIIGYNKRNAFRLRGINFNQNYLYYYLFSDDFKNKIFSNGSIVKFIKIPDLRGIKIPIPKNKELITDLESVFAEIEELQGDVRQAEELYKQLIQELSNEAIPPIAELTEDNIKMLNKDENVDDTPSVKSNSSTKSTLSDLKKECKTLGIKGYSKKNKEELTKMIQDFNTT
jgi:type I restriction-modification system DNA methylase subunit